MQRSSGLSNLFPLSSERADVERRRVHGRGQSRRRPFETVEHLIDARKLRVWIEQSLRLERRGNLRYQMTPGAADVRECRKHPHRRGTKCDEADRLDDIACRSPDQEVVAQLLIGPVHALDVANLFNQSPQRCIDDVRVQLAPTYALG